MRILLALIVLLAFPALAEARPVCGPSKARTLASTGEARLYHQATKTYGCSRGKRALFLGTNATKWRLTGHFAAIARAGALTVFDLRARRTSARPKVEGSLRGLTLTADGIAAWIEDHADGRREIHDSGSSEARDSGRAISPAFVHVANGTISWKKGDYVKFAMYHGDADEYVAGSLGTVGDVELSARRGSIFARYRQGGQVALGRTIDDGDHIGGEGMKSGIETMRVSGRFVAVRENPTGLGEAGVPPGEVRVYDLQRGTNRTLCAERRVWNFVLTPSGGVACVLVSTTSNRIEAEGAVLDQGDESVTDLDLRDGRLVWRHGAETRTAPLPVVPAASVTFPCGPRSAGTFAFDGTARVYADRGVARTCVKGSTRSVSFGAARPIVEVKLNGNAVAVIREAGDQSSLRVYARSNGRVIGERVTAARFGDLVLSPAGVAVFIVGEENHDTLGTNYTKASARTDGTLRITGKVVSWRTGADRLALQELTDDRAIDVPERDGVLWQRGDVTVSLEHGQLAARLGAGAPTVLGRPVTACESPSSCTGVDTVYAGGTIVGSRERSGAVTLRDLATGAVLQPCPAPTGLVSIDGAGNVTCV